MTGSRDGLDVTVKTDHVATQLDDACIARLQVCAFHVATTKGEVGLIAVRLDTHTWVNNLRDRA